MINVASAHSFALFCPWRRDMSPLLFRFLHASKTKRVEEVQKNHSLTIVLLTLTSIEEWKPKKKLIQHFYVQYAICVRDRYEKKVLFKL